MSKFRVDYVTKGGERGEWHCEVDATSAQQVAAQSREEIKDIARDLKRRTDKILKELVVVELVETDVMRIENA